jgi:hypothetical protein
MQWPRHSTRWLTGSSFDIEMLYSSQYCKNKQTMFLVQDYIQNYVILSHRSISAVSTCLAGLRHSPGPGTHWRNGTEQEQVSSCAGRGWHTLYTRTINRYMALAPSISMSFFSPQCFLSVLCSILTHFVFCFLIRFQGVLSYELGQRKGLIGWLELAMHSILHSTGVCVMNHSDFSGVKSKKHGLYRQ